MDNNMVSKSEFKCLLLTFNSKFNVTCKTKTLNACTSELILKKKPQNFLTLHSPFCIFLHQITLKLNCHPSNLESTFLEKNIRYTSRWFILQCSPKMQNLEFINIKCVTYTQPIWTPLKYCRDTMMSCWFSWWGQV